MEWYYIQDNSQMGPVDAASFRKLVSSGVITPQTLVWHAGLAGWRAHGSLAGGEAAQPPAPSEQAVCWECRNSFPKQEMIRHGEAWICAACKPVFLQKLKEGVPLTGQWRYAGFWIRAAASWIDSMVIGLVNIALMFPVGFMAGVQNDPEAITQAGWGYLLAYMISIIFPVAYETYFLGKYGATLGKMAVKIRVISPEGEKISYKRAFARYWAKIVSALIFCIGFIMAGFDDEKRALHDRMCDTRVIRVRAPLR